MEYEKLLKHHTQIIKDQNQNKWEVVEISDLEEICEAYHEAKLKENMVEKCTHITTRNPKEHKENKCRFCGKPYQIIKDKNN